MTAPAVREQLAGRFPVLTLAESDLLRRLGEQGPVRMSVLAEWQGLDRSTVTAQVAGFEARELLVSEADPSYGRAVLVRLSWHAEEALALATSRCLDLLNSFVVDWSEDDRRELAQYLRRLVSSMDGGERA